MNAALIAACAVNARRKHTSDAAPSIRDFEIYYKVKFRKYYYFDAMTIVIPDHESFSGSVFAPIRTLMLKPAQLDARTMAVEHTFSVAASKCPDGIDRYVKNNFEYFTSSRRWLYSDQEVFDKYAAEITRKYKVRVTPGSLSYSTQFHWEVSI